GQSWEVPSKEIMRTDAGEGDVIGAERDDGAALALMPKEPVRGAVAVPELDEAGLFREGHFARLVGKVRHQQGQSPALLHGGGGKTLRGTDGEAPLAGHAAERPKDVIGGEDAI